MVEVHGILPHLLLQLGLLVIMALRCLKTDIGNVRHADSGRF